MLSLLTFSLPFFLSTLTQLYNLFVQNSLYLFRIFVLLLPSLSVSSLGGFSMYRKTLSLLFYLCVFPVVVFNLFQIFFFLFCLNDHFVELLWQEVPKHNKRGW